MGELKESSVIHAPHTLRIAPALTPARPLLRTPATAPTARQVGVVSDYDLLALDKLGKSNASALFPSADETWQVRRAGQEALRLIAKAAEGARASAAAGTAATQVVLLPMSSAAKQLSAILPHLGLLAAGIQCSEDAAGEEQRQEVGGGEGRAHGASVLRAVGAPHRGSADTADALRPACSMLSSHTSAQ